MSARVFSLSILFAAVGLVPAAIVEVRAQDNSDLVYDVQQLLEEVRELRGQVESQQREIENLRRRQRDQYLDLDRRVQDLEQGSTGDSGADDTGSDDGDSARAQPIRPSSDDSPSAEGEQPSGGDRPEVRDPIDAEAEITPLQERSAGESRDLESVSEQEKSDYDSAFRALRETRYADAAEGFSAFLEEHPDSAYAPNALYWLAETYYVTRDFETALDYFDELLGRFPDSGKVGDALLKIGFSHYELERWNEARAALEQVRSEYPGTTLARLAEGRLRDMRMAGHY